MLAFVDLFTMSCYWGSLLAQYLQLCYRQRDWYQFKKYRHFFSVIVVCAKLHEILIVAGLLSIVRQAIQRGLTQGGMLLGLLGDEKSLQTVLFICSQEFRPAFRYGFSEGPRSLKMKIRRIVSYLRCMLSFYGSGPGE